MYQILVTSKYTVHWSSGVGCSVHALVIKFETIQEAEEARKAINLVQDDREFQQWAVALYRSSNEDL